MKTLAPYLFFPGNCREAMNFYKDCLGGEVKIMQTCKEAPVEFPPEADDMIFNSEIVAEAVTIKASDNPELKTDSRGEKNICLFVHCSQRSEFEDVTEKLSAGGEVKMKHDGHFVMLEDKFEFYWMLALGEN